MLKWRNRSTSNPYLKLKYISCAAESTSPSRHLNQPRHPASAWSCSAPCRVFTSPFAIKGTRRLWQTSLSSSTWIGLCLSSTVRAWSVTKVTPAASSDLHRSMVRLRVNLKNLNSPHRTSLIKMMTILSRPWPVLGMNLSLCRISGTFKL